MKKISIFIVAVLMVISTYSQAEQALSKELITSFQKMSAQWDVLETNYPELSISLDDVDLSQPEIFIEKVKNTKAYPKIKSMLAEYDFASVEEYYNIATRVMGGMMSYQMQNMPQGMNVDSMTQMLKQNIQQMKASKAPKSMVDEMEKQLVDMEKNMKNIKVAVKNTSDADIKFIKDNALWIMSLLGEN